MHTLARICTTGAFCVEWSKCNPKHFFGNGKLKARPRSNPEVELVQRESASFQGPCKLRDVVKARCKAALPSGASGAESHQRKSGRFSKLRLFKIQNKIPRMANAILIIKRDVAKCNWNINVIFL